MTRSIQTSDNIIELSGEIRGETERAYRFYDGKIYVWLPKSMCQWDESGEEMQLPEWLAQEKGLI